MKNELDYFPPLEVHRGLYKLHDTMSLTFRELSRGISIDHYFSSH